MRTPHGSRSRQKRSHTFRFWRRRHIQKQWRWQAINELRRGPSNLKFDVTCRNCGKYGHKASDCWSNVSSCWDTKGKGKGKRPKRPKQAKWTKLDKSKNPKMRQDHSSWERFMRHSVVLFVLLNRWNRAIVESTRKKKNLATWSSIWTLVQP